MHKIFATGHKAKEKILQKHLIISHQRQFLHITKRQHLVRNNDMHMHLSNQNILFYSYKQRNTDILTMTEILLQIIDL